MLRKRIQLSLPAPADHSEIRGKLLYYLGHATLAVGALAISHFVYDRFGMQALLVMLAGLVVTSVYTVISFKHIQVPFVVWLASIGGFRFLIFIRTPILPDLSLDRITMIWLAVVFLIKIIAERRSLRGPILLDGLVLIHGLYLLWRVWVHDMTHFHTWTMSYLIPYSAYFLGKNLIWETRWLRRVLLVLLCLSMYYNVTSVAEKFHIHALIWPKYILDYSSGGLFSGRSRGPFLQAALFGTVIGMLLPLYLYFLRITRRYLIKAMLYAGLCVGLAGMYFTYTRGCWLAGFVALAVCTVIGFRQYAKIFLPFAGALMLASMLGLLGIQSDKFLQERMQAQNTVESRVGTMLTVVRVWRDYPVFGVGLFNYRHKRADYLSTEEVPIFGTLRRSDREASIIHDIYWGMLAEDGLVGFSLQMSIYAMIGITLWRKYRYRKQGDHFACYVIPPIAGLFAAYLIGGAVIDYRYFSFVGALFYTMAGILYGYSPRDSGTEAASAAPDVT